MKDDMARVLIWGCGIALIHTIVNLTLWLTCGSAALTLSCYGGLLITLPLCFWGGRKVRQRGYIFSEKIL